MKHTIIAVVVASLTGCSVPVKRQTYDQINADLANAVEANSKAAAVPEAVSAALLPPLQAVPPARPREERFDVAFNSVPAAQFFTAIAGGTRYNMLVHPEVNGMISANLKDVTLFEALDAIRELYGYDYAVDGNRIVIKPLTMQTRVFRINYLSGSRQGSSETRVSTGSISASTPQNNGAGGTSTPAPVTTGQGGTTRLSTDSSKVSSANNSDFWTELKDSLLAIVGDKEGRSVVVSPHSGIVVIRAMPEELRNVATYLNAAQLAVDRQVILEAKIMEVQLNDGYQTGVNWASFANFLGIRNGRGATGFITPGTTLASAANANTLSTTLNTTNPVTGATGATTVTADTSLALGAAGNAAGTLFSLAFQTNNFAAMLSFLETQGTVHVLSSPRIATLNNQKAILKVGTDDFFVTNVSTTTTSSAGGNVSTPSVTLQPFFSGVVLDVTPQIDEQDNITLHVHPSVSQVTTVNKLVDLGNMGSFNLPLASSNASETDSVVRGRDGHIIAIGGLMRQASSGERSQVPGAGDVPGLGALFRSTNKVSQKRELVILIKPSIVRGAAGWNQDLLGTQQRVQGLDPSQAKSQR